MLAMLCLDHGIQHPLACYWTSRSPHPHMCTYTIHTNNLGLPRHLFLNGSLALLYQRQSPVTVSSSVPHSNGFRNGQDQNWKAGIYLVDWAPSFPACLPMKLNWHTPSSIIRGASCLPLFSLPAYSPRAMQSHHLETHLCRLHDVTLYSDLWRLLRIVVGSGGVCL